MRQRGLLISFLTLLIYCGYGNNNNKAIKPDSIEQVRSWIQNQPVKFLENKGQMTDMEGNPVPFVLFKVEAPGVNLYITELGLTIQTLKIQQEHEEEADDGYGSTKPVLSKAEGLTTGLPTGKVEREEKIKIEWERIDVELMGASIRAENILKEEAGITDFNFFNTHCPDGIYGVKEYEKVTIKAVYPGIDWVFYNSSEKGFKYDFVVTPGADYKQIELLYKSRTPIKINKNGEIELSTQNGDIIENAPISFLNGRKISTQFIQNYQKPIEMNGDKGYETSISFFFNFEFVIHNSLLVIDPQLVWATFYGGSNDVDGITSIDIDNTGNIYATGYTNSNNFPTQSWGAAYFNGVLSVAYNNIFILRFSNTGILTWATYYGQGIPSYIHTDALGNIYITGYANPGFNTFSWTGAYNDGMLGGFQDVFILRFTNTGVLTWATYYGGSSNDAGTCITTDPAGNIFVVGKTESADFTSFNLSGAYNDPLWGGGEDMFLLRFSNTGLLTWSTFYGGTTNDAATSMSIDFAGNIYVSGQTQSADFPIFPRSGAYNDATLNMGSGSSYDAFILRFTSAGSLTWATYYGGSSNDGHQAGTVIITDVSGNVYVTGQTQSTNFLTLPWIGAYNDAVLGGLQDIFLIRFSITGALTWSTYYGGSSFESIAMIFPYSNDNLIADNCGNIYLTFETASTDITTLNLGCGSYFDSSHNGGSRDQFIVKLNNNGMLLWATYFAGDGFDHRSPIAIDNNNNLVMAGEWTNVPNNNTCPLVDPGGGTYYDPTFNGVDDSFISKFIPIVPTHMQSQNNNTTCSPCNGTATINISCGTPGYSYLWSNGSSTLNSVSATNTITGLCPGTYTVTATSNCNQIQIATFVITGTSCSGITASATSAIMCQGVIPCPVLTASGLGGTTPYTYTWSNGAKTQNINPCPASITIYTVTITDLGGATATATATVTINPAVTVSAIPTNITCNGGTSSAAAGSGSAPYAYSWNNGQTIQTATGLIAGNYTVTITDANGCTANAIATIISPPPLAGQFTKGTANCSDCGCKEWIMVNATGGTSPYTYLWPDGYIDRYKNRLCPGTYTINIKDKNGCSVNVNLTAP